MTTSKNNFQFPRTIDSQTVNQLPLATLEANVHVINTDDAVEQAVSALEHCSVLGFDTETRPSFRKGDSYPTALIQLATPSDVYLFQLLRLTHTQPILDLLSRRDILKVGVAIHDDVKKLGEVYDYSPKSFIEISTITRRAGVINTGLRNLTAIFLNARISKQAQTSNWSKPELSEQQTQYAAMDAWISLMLYRKLVDLQLDVQP
jgi:ribonuclease D